MKIWRVFPEEKEGSALLLELVTVWFALLTVIMVAIQAAHLSVIPNDFHLLHGGQETKDESPARVIFNIGCCIP
jgi:hypothetical protein